MAANHLADLKTIIEDLDSQGCIAHVQSEVALEHDLAGIAAKLEGQPNAVIFNNVKGHSAAVFTGLYWSRELLGQLLRKPAAELPQFVSRCIQNWQSRPVPPQVVSDGPVLQGQSGLTLDDIPIPVHALKDGGRYLDAGVVIATDPETGVRNASIQRFMVVDERTLHVNIDAGRHLGLYLDKAREQKKSLFISINCGVGPGLHFAAATPAEAAPPDTDELGIVSEFNGAPLQLVPGKMTPTELVGNAMYAIECEMIPGEMGEEGPFAEVTGYYARREPRPIVRVRAIHARPDPVFQTIISGAEVWNSVGLLGEANVLAMLKRQVPGVQDVYFTHGGCGFYHAVVSLAQKRAGWGKQAIMAAFAAFAPLKMVTVVDDDVDIRNASDVEWAMATRLDPVAGIVTIEKCFGHGLNPSFPDYLGAKVGFDCTRPYPHSYEYDRAAYKPMDMSVVSISRAGLSKAASGDRISSDENSAAASESFAAIRRAKSNTLLQEHAKVRNELPEVLSSSSDYVNSPKRASDIKGVPGLQENRADEPTILIAHIGVTEYANGVADELFLDLEARFVGMQAQVDIERMRTTTELSCWLKANRDIYTHIVLVADGGKKGIRFLDQKKPLNGAALGKILLAAGGQIQLLTFCNVRQHKTFSAALSQVEQVSEVIAVKSADPQWHAHLAAGYFLSQEKDLHVEQLVRQVTPVGCGLRVSIWRNGELFTRLG